MKKLDTEALYSPYADDKYRVFAEKCTKVIDRPFIGVRLPVLRKLATEIRDIDFTVVYHEDVLLRGFWIGNKKLPFKSLIPLINEHLKYLETWDETDAFASALKIRKNDSDTAYEYFMSLLGRERIMERRLGIVSLMKNRKLFADKKSKILEAITASDSDEYYISMAVAWALTSFIMDDRDNEAWLEKLSDATRQKTKQKIRDSERERKKK